MKLSIISLNYKKPELTIASMQSVYSHYKKHFDDSEFEYIVVDNCSQDASVEKLKKEAKKYPNFRVVENTVNSGFGAGNNLGVSRAKGEYLLFLNNDTIVGKGLDDMLSYLVSHPQIGILGGVLRNPDGTSQSSVGAFYFLPQVFMLLLGMQRFEFIDKNPTHITSVDWVKGALFLISKQLFEKVHGFDEHIFMYTEDMELCYRVHLLGKEIASYPYVEVSHKDQGSSNRTFAIIHIYKGLLYFYRKHMPGWQYRMVKLLLQTKAICLISYGKLLRKEYFIETYEKALAATR